MKLLIIIALSFSATALAQDEEFDGDVSASTSEEITDLTSSIDDTAPATANSESNEPPPRVQPEPFLRRIKEVVKHLGLYDRDQEVIKFSDDDASISGLYLPENTGKPQGGVLILHDIDQHAHWPNTIGPLREYLPDYGWNTLSLFFEGYISPPLPDIPKLEPKVPPLNDTASPEQNELNESAPIEEGETLVDEDLTETPDENLEDQNFDNDETPSDNLDSIAADFQPFPIPDNESPSDNTEEESVSDVEAFLEAMTGRVEGGLRQLNTLGQFNLVVIAHGLSANWAANTLQARFEQNPGAKGYALVMIDAQQSAYPEYDLNQTLSQFEIPILDIYTGQSPQEKRIAKRRKDAIIREQKADYWQINLPSIHSSTQKYQTMITRRVRGWLKTHAAGEEVNVAEKRY